MLLASLGKGSALLTSTAPLHSLASTGSVTPGGKICSISGIQSAAHSAPTNLPTCGGWSPGRYKKHLEHWPPPSTRTGTGPYTVGSPNRGTVTFNHTSPFNAVFGSGRSETLIHILQNDASSDEFHWIPALLNAMFGSIGGMYTFPYSSTEILGFYEAGGDQRAAALALIKGYLEFHGGAG